MYIEAKERDEFEKYCNKKIKENKLESKLQVKTSEILFYIFQIHDTNIECVSDSNLENMKVNFDNILEDV